MFIRSITAATVLLACLGASAQSITAIPLDGSPMPEHGMSCVEAQALEAPTGMTLNTVCEDPNCGDREMTILLDSDVIAINLGCASTLGF